MVNDINHQRDAYAISNIHNFIPQTDVKFEINQFPDDINFLFFANATQETKIHIRYNSDDLPQEP